jgi:hypothetical protein
MAFAPWRSSSTGNADWFPGRNIGALAFKTFARQWDGPVSVSLSVRPGRHCGKTSRKSVCGQSQRTELDQNQESGLQSEVRAGRPVQTGGVRVHRNVSMPLGCGVSGILVPFATMPRRKQQFGKQIGLRLPDDLLELVREAAEKSGWSLTEQIRYELSVTRGLWKPIQLLATCTGGKPGMTRSQVVGYVSDKLKKELAEINCSS